jgi:hypothetical protein
VTAEARRLKDARDGRARWKRWGPYLSERQWGTVREDYSPHGNAWEYLPHEHARSRAYRWGEDGLAGFSDMLSRLCLSVALWNGVDPILKERLFGLTNSEGNHGEDVKELYWYLDATPSHSYNRFLYKYPQAPFPYADLVEENGRRGKEAPEYELLDTGVFDERRYFDVDVIYAKAAPEDIVCRITVTNRGPDAATLHVLPQVWLRNTWSWDEDAPRPELVAIEGGAVEVLHPRIGPLVWQSPAGSEVLFTENETNMERVFGFGEAGHTKDAFHRHVVDGEVGAVSPHGRGTKAAAHLVLALAPGESRIVDVRLSPPGHAVEPAESVIAARKADADEFYETLQHGMDDPDARLVHRQALAGMLWAKQYYGYAVDRWLDGDPTQPDPPPGREHGRNRDWRHLDNADVISMPDPWEYPWYAAWDLAFHAIPLALVDVDFAKEQLALLTREWYMHPNGQLPAYEWALGDVNPPVHAWAAWRVFQIDRKQRGDDGDLLFLERIFHKLMLNFTWWVNRKDAEGRNVFQGGFLGLDNIGVFDRSSPLPTGGYINQSDGTAWMGMYCLNLMRMAIELALHNPAYEDVATKFFEHFLYIAKAMTAIGDEGVGLWDDDDKFYYDVLELPGHQIPMKIRSLVGLIPLFAVEVIEPEVLERLPGFAARMEWHLRHRPDLASLVSRWKEPGKGERRLLSLLRGHRMKRILARMLDEQEFLSPHGIRGLSRYHHDHPYRFEHDGTTFSVAYLPAESDSGVFGGNSNWRGPIWFPMNYLLVESIQRFHHYYSDDFRVECPTGSGELMTLEEVAGEISHRLTTLFLRGADGRRPVFGDSAIMQDDPHFRDNVLFYEYFHGDNGRGVGASHQTGWTGLVAKLLQPRRSSH